MVDGAQSAEFWISGLVASQIPGKPMASLREVSMQRVIQSVLAAAVLLGTASTAR